MPKVKCPCGECVHNGENYVCQADNLSLGWRNMLTVNEGRVDMWICKQYELSNWAKRIDENIREFMENRGRKTI